MRKPILTKRSPEEEHERLMQKMEAGRDAAMIKAIVRDAIDRHMINACQSLMNMYRQGGIDHDLIIGKIGEMAGLQDLLSDLDSQERQGIAASGKVFRDAET